MSHNDICLEVLGDRKSVLELGELLFNPRSIAIIGTSPNKTSITGQPLQHLLERKYEGRIYPITPKFQEISGIKCYPTVADMPEPADLAVIIVNAVRVPEVLSECGKKGVKVAVIISGGFAEAGAEGVALQEKLRQVSEKEGIRVVGPNCQGLLNVGERVCAGFGPILSPEYGVQDGGLSFVTQSGGFGYGLVNILAQQGIGFRRVISTGNESDLSAVDFIEQFILDPKTRVVAAYMEGLKDGWKLKALGDLALQNDKPILLWKVGSSDVGKRAASSHTASMGGDAAVASAIFKQIGAIELGSVEDFIDYSKALLKQKRPAGNRVAILSASGGAGVLISDECVRSGLEVPLLPEMCRRQLSSVAPALGTLQNPIDVMGKIYDEPHHLKQALEVIANEPSIDSIVVINPIRKGERAAQIAAVIAEVDQSTDKPVFVSWAARKDFAAEAYEILNRAGIPCFYSPDRCAKALGMLARYADARRRITGAVVQTQPSSGATALHLLQNHSGSTLSEYVAKQVLSAYGIPITREKLATSPEEALEFARNLHYPVAMKVQSQDIAHKTEAGVVRLGINSPEELAPIYAELIDRAIRFSPNARIEGVLLQEMVGGGVEVIVGVFTDPSFGPIVMFGLGGIYAEVLRDVSFRSPPISHSVALEMISETKCYQILSGARGRAPSDINALVEVIVQVGNLAIDLQSEIIELDINPLAVLAKGKGVKALDALIVTRA